MGSRRGYGALAAQPRDGVRAASGALPGARVELLRRRLLLYMSSISLGVAALVAIDSFSTKLHQ